MLKRLDYFLNIVIGLVIGVYIGNGIYAIWDYKTHPDLYVIQSAPWYTGICVSGVFTIAVLMLLVIIKLIIRKKIK